MASIDFPLKGKIILITGGGSGIGLSLTRQSAALGACVLVADLRTTADFDKLASSDPNIVYMQTDVTKWSDFQKLFAVCEEKWNDVPDAYGICAGVFEPPFSNFWQDPEDEETEGGYKQVRINLDHPMKLTRMAIKKSLGRGKRASVCIIASMSGYAANIALPIYTATKHAILGFVKSVGPSEALTGVKITTICPSLVNTPLIDSQKRKQFNFSEGQGLSPDVVAKNMLKLIQEKELGSGTVLEVAAEGTRVIPEWYARFPFCFP
ncbi:NAD(P)-binding protein [Byssothecium circinans]|uniref:NAD(P)-binding protein n=1 Tax=Byssothecium circinans TaxID=147558 RepID=A0A6A5U8N0_9PLEO|nr:NAD(P)-binding protein [Byssothecium circinans]